MNRRAALAILVGLACAFEGADLGALGLETDQGSVAIETEKTDVAGLASIEVHSSVAGSTVSINRVDVNYSGISPSIVPAGGSYIAGVGATGVDYTIYQNDSLTPGSYIIGASAPGYYKREVALILDEKTKYYIYFSLAMISGTLDLSVTPEDATILVDGHAATAGALILPVGQHSLTVRRFGYAEQSISALVREKETTSLSVALTPAAFSVSQLAPSREAFNPSNAGVFGRVDLRFRVESFGSGRMTISNADGAVVAAADFLSFDAWEQRFTWNGRDEAGAPLPDGEYKVRLVAQAQAAAAAPGSAQQSPAPPAEAPLVREAAVRIDSSLIIRPRGSLSAVPGLLFFPDPRGENAGTSSAELSWLSPTADMLNPSFALNGAVAVSPKIDLAYGAAAENLSSSRGGVDLALSLRYALWSRQGQSPERSGFGALFLRGSWSDATAPLLPDAPSSFEISVPFALGLGPISLGAAPGAKLDFSSSQANFGVSAEALTRVGLWTATSVFRAGLSAELDFADAQGYVAPSWPLDVGAELRVLLEPSPLELSVLAIGGLSPYASPSFTVGLGLGLLF